MREETLTENIFTLIRPFNARVARNVHNALIGASRVTVTLEKCEIEFIGEDGKVYKRPDTCGPYLYPSGRHIRWNAKKYFAIVTVKNLVYDNDNGWRFDAVEECGQGEYCQQIMRRLGRRLRELHHSITSSAELAA